MKQIFRDEGSQRDHSDEDCFFAFVLSHGARGYVYGTDGRKLSIEDDMVTPLCGDSCPSLLNKPKVFFIQACQGGMCWCVLVCVCVRVCVSTYKVISLYCKAQIYVHTYAHKHTHISGLEARPQSKIIWSSFWKISGQ